MNECDHLEEFLSHVGEDARVQLKKRFSLQRYDRGEYIFTEGDPNNNLYLIESGTIEANTVRADGRIFIFHFVFPGQVFGEGTVYGEEYAVYSALARKKLVVWRVPKADLLAAIRSDATLQSYLLRLIGHKLEASYIKARCTGGEKVEKRIACLLLRSDSQGQRSLKCQERLDVPLTNRDLSGLVGSTEETVSRVMSRLKKEEIIAIEDKKLKILDRESLLGFFDTV